MDQCLLEIGTTDSALEIAVLLDRSADEGVTLAYDLRKLGVSGLNERIVRQRQPLPMAVSDAARSGVDGPDGSFAYTLLPDSEVT